MAILWPLLRPILPYLLTAGAIYGGWWYVDSLRSEITRQRADIEAANEKVQKAHAHIRQRIDAERQQRAADAESAKLARMARDRIGPDVRRVREYVTVPAPAPSHTDSGGNCVPAQPVEAAAGPDRLGEILEACAATDAERSILAAEVMRLQSYSGDVAKD